jgi:hypothetical protein
MLILTKLSDLASTLGIVQQHGVNVVCARHNSVHVASGPVTMYNSKPVVLGVINKVEVGPGGLTRWAPRQICCYNKAQHLKCFASIALAKHVRFSYNTP